MWIGATLTGRRRRCVRGLLAAGAGCAVLLAAAALSASPASAFSKAIWGPTQRNGVDQFPMYHRLGVSIYEADLNWASVATSQPAQPTNPDDPAYHWPHDLAYVVRQTRRFHMRVLLQVIATPRWANGGKAWNWAPDRPADYARFVAAAAAHYPGVHLWMIWGEPTRTPNFEPLTPARPNAPLTAAQQQAPHIYSEMLDDAYGTLKRISRSNLVIGGCTYTTGDISTQQWIENLRLPSGRVPRMDMYAHNPFSLQPPAFTSRPSPDGVVQFSDLRRLAAWIDRYLHKPLPIFLSEWTIPTGIDQQFNFYVDPTVAASWIRQALSLVRGWSRIYALGWINVYDSPPTSYGGLLTSTGVPKPSFYAFGG